MEGKQRTYPEDTDTFKRAKRRSVWFDHAEHSVQLPADEENDEKVMRIPKPFEVDLALFLTRKVMIARMIVITQPVAPGPVAKLAITKFLISSVRVELIDAASL